MEGYYINESESSREDEIIKTDTIETHFSTMLRPKKAITKELDKLLGSPILLIEKDIELYNSEEESNPICAKFNAEEKFGIELDSSLEMDENYRATADTSKGFRKIRKELNYAKLLTNKDKLFYSETNYCNYKINPDNDFIEINLSPAKLEKFKMLEPVTKNFNNLSIFEHMSLNTHTKNSLNQKLMEEEDTYN